MGLARDQGQIAIDWAFFMQNQYRATCRAIDRLMPRSLRSTYDPEDFVDEAIVELLAKPEKLIEKGPSLLILVAKRRMIDAARSPQSRFMRFNSDLIDRQPSPALEHDAAELCEFMLGRAGDHHERNIVDLRSKGHTLPEIAELMGVGVRQLQRFWKRFAEAYEPY